jgi:hypothetical protein
VRLAAVLGLAWAADLLTFALVVPVVGIGAESNPLMVRAYLLGGVLAILGLKLACFAAAAALVYVARRRGHPYVLAGFVAFAIPAFGTIGNLAAAVR